MDKINIMCNNKMRFLLLFVLLTNYNLKAQTVRINEVVSSNSVYTDEDGDNRLVRNL